MIGPAKKRKLHARIADRQGRRWLRGSIEIMVAPYSRVMELEGLNAVNRYARVCDQERGKFETGGKRSLRRSRPCGTSYSSISNEGISSGSMSSFEVTRSLKGKFWRAFMASQRTNSTGSAVNLT